MTKPVLYLIGSLRNPTIPGIANRLRAIGYDVFDDWHAAGPTADDEWKRYETERGRTYQQALMGHAAQHVFEFDLYHLNRCDLAVLVLPAGRSGHLELGYVIGEGKPAYVLMDNPDRWDVMYQFATNVFFDVDELVADLSSPETPEVFYIEHQPEDRSGLGWYVRCRNLDYGRFATEAEANALLKKLRND
jgi:hypothetical protein